MGGVKIKKKNYIVAGAALTRSILPAAEGRGVACCSVATMVTLRVEDDEPAAAAVCLAVVSLRSLFSLLLPPSSWGKKIRVKL